MFHLRVILVGVLAVACTDGGGDADIARDAALGMCEERPADTIPLCPSQCPGSECCDHFDTLTCYYCGNQGFDSPYRWQELVNDCGRRPDAPSIDSAFDLDARPPPDGDGVDSAPPPDAGPPAPDGPRPDSVD